MALHLHALSLLVRDYDEAIAWFVGTLGFDLVEDTPLPAGKRWVVVAAPGGGSRILLASAADDVQRGAVGNQSGGRVFLFLATDDFARDHSRMVSAGVTFTEAPRHESYGRVAVFLDPFGNRWDLVERRCGAR